MKVFRDQLANILLSYFVVKPEFALEAADIMSDFLSDIAKAYGDCDKCWGKGYGTEMKGEHYSADFVFDKPYNTPLRIQMIYCTCSRGKQLKELIEVAQ